MFQPCPDIAQFNMVYDQEGQFAENVFHVKSGDPWTIDKLHATSELFANWFSGSQESYCANSTLLLKIYARDLSTEFAAEDTYIDGLPITGARSNAALPQVNTFALKADTGLTGRSNRGRSYIVGMTDNMVDTTGHVLTTIATALLASYNFLITSLVEGGTDLTPVVLTRRHNNADRPAGLGVPIIRYVTTDLAVDTQRRRLPGHNRHR